MCLLIVVKACKDTPPARVAFPRDGAFDQRISLDVVPCGLFPRPYMTVINPCGASGRHPARLFHAGSAAPKTEDGARACSLAGKSNGERPCVLIVF